jgi:glycosyltransferase involved in cell wall biosynthesis
MSERKVLLYRRTLDLRSGAGQLLLTQLLGLEAAGVRTAIACERGALRFWLRTRRRARHTSALELAAWQRDGWLVIDHEASVPSAQIVYVHNVASESRRHTLGEEHGGNFARERDFFSRLSGTALIVANSELVKRVLVRDFGLTEERVTVLYPGFDAERFNLETARRLRPGARAALGLDDRTPLVGFVTSGDFAKRGLDVFLAAATRIAAARSDVRFLVVGSKQLPRYVLEHPLWLSERVHYRPKTRVPERWFAALDVFLYAAHFEEFGMVITEAQAMGIPVLTSRRVGAAECLPTSYGEWLLEQPDAVRFADLALALLDNAQLRQQLGASAAAQAAKYDRRAYVSGTLALLSSLKNAD